MAASLVPSLWHASFHANVRAPLDKVWEATGNFEGVDKWAPSVVSSCTLLEGDSNTKGCLRNCDGADGRFLGKERLLEMREDINLYKYKVEDSIIPGLAGYVSTFHVSDAGDNTTNIEWSYEVPPIPSSTPEAFRDLIFGYYQLCITDLENYLARN